MPVFAQSRCFLRKAHFRVRTAGPCGVAAGILFLCVGLLSGCTGFIVPSPEEETAVSAGAPAETADPARAAALAGEATTLFKQSRFPEAEAKFRAALTADPGHVPALTGISDFYTYFPERWQEALAYAEQAFAVAPEDAAVLAHLTWAQQLAHRFEEAIDTAEAAIAADPDNALAQAAYADMALSLYQPAEALVHIEKALAIDPDNAVAHVLLSLIQETLHDWPAAEEAAARAVALEPDFHLWKIVLGRRAFDLNGDPIAALEIAAPTIAALPDHPFVIGFEVDMAIELNEWDKAIAGCARMAEIGTPETPYPDGFTCQANVAMLMEDYEAAAQYQDKAEAAAWDDRFDISMTRMFLLNNAEECEESRAVAQKWLDTRPYSMAAQRMMGVGFMCSDDWEQAIPFLTVVNTQLPTSVTDARLLAISYARNEMKSEATKTLTEVRNLAFNDPLYYQAQYELNFILGDLEASIDNAQRWSIFRPYSSDANEAVAFAHLYNGDLDAARKAAENAFDKGSTSSTVNSRAVLRLRARRAQDARTVPMSCPACSPGDASQDTEAPNSPAPDRRGAEGSLRAALEAATANCLMRSGSPSVAESAPSVMSLASSALALSAVSSTVLPEPRGPSSSVDDRSAVLSPPNPPVSLSNRLSRPTSAAGVSPNSGENGLPRKVEGRSPTLHS